MEKRKVKILLATAEDRQLNKHKDYDFVYYNVKGPIWYIIKNEINGRLGKIHAYELNPLLAGFDTVGLDEPKETPVKQEKKKEKRVKKEDHSFTETIEPLTDPALSVADFISDTDTDNGSSYDSNESSYDSSSSDSFSGDGGDFGGGGSSGDF